MLSIFYMETTQEIIAIKRAYRALSHAQIEKFVTGVVSGKFRDYQASALLVGAVVRLLASGRAQAVTVIDLAMGLVFEKKTGDLVELGDVLCHVYFKARQSLDPALDRLRRAITYSAQPVTCTNMVIDRISES